MFLGIAANSHPSRLQNATASHPKPLLAYDGSRGGDNIRVNLYHGKIEDAVVRTVIVHKDGLKL